MDDELYYKFSRFCKLHYRKNVQRICIDGGFTCPNRDGRCGVGGCIFCGERGAGDYLDRRLSVREQVGRRLDGYCGRKRFIAYFQSFTSTYAPVGRLKELYDEALCSELIVALAVATRPDCIDEPIAELLESYKSRCDVWVELGLQTSDDRTARFVNRGCESAVFLRAAEILTAHGIPFVVHLMIGLPGEGAEQLAETVRFVNAVKPWGIKLHSVYVMGGTVLEALYREGKYSPPTLEEYVRGAAYVISHIPPEMVIHRLMGDCPPDLLIAPDWSADKRRVLAELEAYMRENGLRQGSEYEA